MIRQHAHKSPASIYPSLALVAALGVTLTATTAAQQTKDLADNETFTADASNTLENTRFDASRKSGVELRIGRNLLYDNKEPIEFNEAESSIVKILSDVEIKGEDNIVSAVNYNGGSSSTLQNAGKIITVDNTIDLQNAKNFTLVNEKTQ